MTTLLRRVIPLLADRQRTSCAEGMILLYHRVTNLKPDPQWLCVSPGRFSEQMELLRRSFHPLPLGELVRHGQQGTLPSNAVAVTFDDGYADNLSEALPILEQFQIPATIFVATGHLEKEHEFWWDEIEALMLANQRADSLSLTLHGGTHTWMLSESPQTAANAAAANWNMTIPDCPTPRHQAFREVVRLIKRASLQQRDHLMQQLREWAGGAAPPRQTHRRLTADEIRELARSELVELGAHTVTHPVLSALSRGEQQWEITESKHALEEVLGREIVAFAYPCGARADYTPDSVALVRQAGFQYACSNFSGRVRPNTDALQLPRFLVRDWDADELLGRMEGWMHG